MSMEINKPKREFISENLKIDSWESIKEYYQNLLARKISTSEEFEKWLIDLSELDAVM